MNFVFKMMNSAFKMVEFVTQAVFDQLFQVKTMNSLSTIMIFVSKMMNYVFTTMNLTLFQLPPPPQGVVAVHLLHDHAPAEQQLVSKVINFALKTRKCVLKTRSFVFKMMNFAFKR